jgi:acetylornithine deacetylase/succinyl-diaminopimelate desuccinylase-like protein
MTTPAHQYAQDHAESFINQLCDLIRIPSVSTKIEHAPDVERAANWLIADMERIGLRAELHQAEGFLPLVYGEWLGAGENAPTVLVYCHYDVQPAEKSDGWDTEPFEPTRIDGKIYGRGALDSKIHATAHLKALESALATNSLPVNVKLLFEGEEESASAHIVQFVKNNADKLKSDVIVISDGSMPDKDQPVLVYGLRGVIQFEVTVTGPHRNLHSGHYGGTVHNPLQALIEILGKLHDEEGHVTVDGFYDEVRPVSDDERKILSEIGKWTAKEWEIVANAPQVWGEPEFALHERIGARPTLEINGMAGGFYEQGFMTVIPHKAWAKISCRLVPDQDGTVIAGRVIEALKKHTPDTVKIEIEHHPDNDSAGVLLDYQSASMQAVIKAYELGWGRKPLLNREGGSVPVVASIQESLSGELVLMPFGYKGGGAHSTNEFIFEEMFHRGIATTLHFYHILAGK